MTCCFSNCHFIFHLRIAQDLRMTLHLLCFQQDIQSCWVTGVFGVVDCWFGKSMSCLNNLLTNVMDSRAHKKHGCQKKCWLFQSIWNICWCSSNWISLYGWNKTFWNHHLWPKLLILGMVIAPFIGNSLLWVYKPLLLLGWNQYNYTKDFGETADPPPKQKTILEGGPQADRYKWS